MKRAVTSHLMSVVGPRRPLHVALLHVKGEVLHVHVAGGAVDAVGQPGHAAVGRHDHVGVDGRRGVLGVRARGGN